MNKLDKIIITVEENSATVKAFTGRKKINPLDADKEELFILSEMLKTVAQNIDEILIRNQYKKSC